MRFMTRILSFGRGARDITTSASDRQVRLALLLVIVALSGCKKDGPVERFACDCPFLTDFDDGSAQRVEVCATGISHAVEVARGCAQSAAPAPIQSCTCRPSKQKTACKAGYCEAKAER